MGLASPFQAGSEITAALLSAAAPLAAFKYADFNVGPSNTTLTNDPDLSLPLLANGVYVGHAMIVFAASTAAAYKAGWSVPAGATLVWNPNLYIGTGGTVQPNQAALGNSSTFAQACQGTAQNLAVAIQFSIIVGATAGTLQYQFAQNTSDASNCNTRAGSFLLGWKIA